MANEKTREEILLEEIASLKQRLADTEEVLDDKRRLARELNAILGCPTSESLCDAISVVESRVSGITWKNGFPEKQGIYVCRKVRDRKDISLYCFVEENVSRNLIPWIHLSGWFDSSLFEWLDIEIDAFTSKVPAGFIATADSAPPLDGSPIEVLASIGMRFHRYSPHSEQFKKRGIRGRWQEINDHSGWENTDRVFDYWRPVQKT